MPRISMVTKPIPVCLEMAGKPKKGGQRKKSTDSTSNKKGKTQKKQTAGKTHKKSEGKSKGSKSRFQVDIFNEHCMENAYYICHNVQDVLKCRGFPWPEAQNKKKKGKKK